VRYAAGHKEESRARILKAAADLFRRQGIAATGVDAVMAAAGLTAGGFYAHFRSKDALVAAAVATAGERGQERWLKPLAELRGAAWARGFVERYVSEEHRDDRATGCLVPSLAADVARSGTPPRQHFEQNLRGLFALVERHAGGEAPDARKRALSAVALCVGGVLLSRVVLDHELSREILAACRTSALRLLELEGNPPPAGSPA
jgi:TetR/AcrR family transcriptional regulator, transcriptional repressor for nem operon